MPARTVKFCPYDGSPTEIRLIFNEEHPVCPTCGWVSVEDPKVAVAALIETEAGVLLTRRIYPPYQDQWSLPAGFLNAHEDPQTALRRECLEETGLNIQVGDLLRILSGREHPSGADLILVYRANITGGILTAGDDAGAAAFFPRSALPPLAFRSTREILNQTS